MANPQFGDVSVRGIITKIRSIQIIYCGIIHPACDKCQGTFHTTADNNHPHGSFVGQYCQGQAQEITVEVILCKYSRQIRMRVFYSLVLGRMRDGVFKKSQYDDNWISQAVDFQLRQQLLLVGSSSQADYLMRNAAMDDSIGGS